MTPKEATDKNIITKQVVINTPTSARLLPITADEKVIDEIQQSLTELEELKKEVKELLGLLDVYKSHYVADEELSDLINKVIEVLS